MTDLLISVTSLKEAEIAIQAGVDMLDMKNPAEGALGRLPFRVIEEIVKLAGGRGITSATIGDLPMQPEQLASATEKVAATGVDIVKIGFFANEHHEACANAVGLAAGGRVKLVGVLMADEFPDFRLISILKAAGFYGVMLDTAKKQNNHLLDHLSIEQLQVFCSLAKSAGLMAGLAGSLKESHIPVLVKLSPDYLGFRGAVCQNANRIAQLDEGRLKLIKNMLYKNNKQRQIA